MSHVRVVPLLGVLLVASPVWALEDQKPANIPAAPNQQEAQAKPPSNAPGQRATDVPAFAEATMEAIVVSKAPPRFVLNLFGQTGFHWETPDTGLHDTFNLGDLSFLFT